MGKLNDILKECETIIIWYGDNGGLCQDITHLIRCRTKLSTMSYTLAAFAGDSKSEFLTLNAKRKYTYFQEVERLRKENISKEKSEKLTMVYIESQASIFVQEIRGNEAIAEGASNRLKLLLFQINEILGALSQQISFLKEEKKQAPHHI